MDCNDQYGTQEDRKGDSEEGSGRVHARLIQKGSRREMDDRAIITTLLFPFLP
jgi:hypothetical protein